MNLNIIQKYFLSFLFFLVLGSSTVAAQVYPGDVNNDGIVDNTDFLYIGILFGQVGPPRDIAEQGTFFEEKTITTLWGTTFSNGVDYAYADCDGNGLINFEDFDAVFENFFMTHGTVMPEVFPNGNIGLDPPLTFDSSFIFGPFPEYAFVAIPVSLGTPEIPVNEFYGLSFEIHYDPTIVWDGSITFDFSASSWIDMTGNDLHFSPLDPTATPGVLKVAATRLSPLPSMNNFGQIGTLQFIIEDNLVDYAQPNLETMLQFQEVIILGPNGSPVPTVNDSITIEIMDNEVLANDPVIPEDEIHIFPNPFQDRLTLKAENDQIESIRLYDLNGKLITDILNVNKLETELILDHIPPGVYVIKVQNKEGILTRKISKFD